MRPFQQFDQFGVLIATGNIQEQVIQSNLTGKLIFDASIHIDWVAPGVSVVGLRTRTPGRVSNRCGLADRRPRNALSHRGVASLARQCSRLQPRSRRPAGRRSNAFHVRRYERLLLRRERRRVEARLLLSECQLRDHPNSGVLSSLRDAESRLLGPGGRRPRRARRLSERPRLHEPIGHVRGRCVAALRRWRGQRRRRAHRLSRRRPGRPGLLQHDDVLDREPGLPGRHRQRR